jgi:3-phenylpropionate/trans-cinnamate dioxygenase ferredoxin reductase subunit
MLTTRVCTPMRRRIDHLLIGGGIASATCAAELRTRGAEGSIAVVGREVDAPYHRPPITKGYLRGDQSRDDALIMAPGWWDANGVELLTRTSVTTLDLAARVATLSTREEVEFDQVLLATGAMVRRLPVDGSELDGIHYLRALGNADALRRDVADAERVVLVGGSYVGCEVAATLTTLGKHCTVLMPERHPLEHTLGATAGRFLRRVLERHGVEVIGEDELAGYEGADGRVATVRTRRGRALAADAVVVGVGAQPDALLARKAGLEIGGSGGVRCDAHLRASAAGVFAAGDVCEYDSALHGGRVRIEHEAVAADQGRTAAANMLGDLRPHRTIPYFWSDLADWVSLDYVGSARAWDEEVVRGSVQEERFSIWYRLRGRLVATLSVGDPSALPGACWLMAAGQVAPAEDGVGEWIPAAARADATPRRAARSIA